MRAIRVFFAAVLFATVTFATPTGATSANTDLSDIWWNPDESGWGMQMVNTGTFVFATIYVYGPNGSPTWYTGQLNLTSDNQVSFTGPLYLTNGPYYGGSFNPNVVVGRQVGTMTFVGLSVETGRLSYSVDGVVVNKTVERQPLTLDDYGGLFVVAISTSTATNCSDPAANGKYVGNYDITFLQSGSSMTQIWRYSSGLRCTYTGKYSQAGRMGSFLANGTCSTGESADLYMFEMNNGIDRFMARYALQQLGSCTFRGYIAGVGRQ